MLIIKFIIIIFIIGITYFIESYHKNNNINLPFHTIIEELFMIFICFSIYLKINNLPGIFLLIPFFLHLWRLIINYKIYISLPITYQITGIFSIASIFNDYTFILNPIIRILSMNHFFTNKNGFNKHIDIPFFILATIFYKLYIANSKNILSNIETNYFYADVLYHILKIIQ